ncbi:3-ketosteroid-9-alpha-monooxygenase, oxygenase component [BD1-7 clade bacterium]|uniref:3-ketosteroid-9-alpha-monooxygenase, oxygenase component n=1 Tax=BD1-7 clade bacterium TaxID=2029982 RepID=A0A5S9Q481_9GAMM|nr:3-ketosteroid-9-alpha-monooxygenase, oxygenase component [BD1-7 clade bacterium]CAA0112481.1 3-ketosteroid-9-alpha-monooxygenase, oxygenase component [BD1-7 clade bacterium]
MLDLPFNHKPVGHIYPPGWYAIALTKKLKPGDIEGFKAFGKYFVVYRTEAGKPKVTDGFCPHRGNDMARGGFVEGNELVCGSHGRRFGEDGRCTEIPGCPTAAKQHLKTYEVDERDGIVRMWHSNTGAKPGWKVPNLPKPQDGEWGPVKWNTIGEYRTNIDIFNQDVIDNTHFFYTHGVSEASTVIDIEHEALHAKTRGLAKPSRLADLLRVPTIIRKDRPIAYRLNSIWNKVIDQISNRLNSRMEGNWAELHGAIHGMGMVYYRGTLDFKMFKQDYLIVSLPVPIDEKTIQVRLGVALSRKPSLIAAILGTPRFFSEIKAGFEMDRPLWEGLAIQGAQFIENEEDGLLFQQYHDWVTRQMEYDYPEQVVHIQPDKKDNKAA